MNTDFHFPQSKCTTPYVLYLYNLYHYSFPIQADPDLTIEYSGQEETAHGDGRQTSTTPNILPLFPNMDEGAEDAMFQIPDTDLTPGDDTQQNLGSLPGFSKPITLRPLPGNPPIQGHYWDISQYH